MVGNMRNLMGFRKGVFFNVGRICAGVVFSDIQPEQMPG